jgi:hypothetical protein
MLFAEPALGRMIPLLPDSVIGVPGNDNPNAGRISSTAYDNQDPQRNLQFGVRLSF